MIRLPHRAGLVCAAAWAAVIVSALVAGPLAAQTATLGTDGLLYKVIEGKYGELFDDAMPRVRNNAALALDIVAPDGTERLLVPGTRGHAIETNASVVSEPASGRIFLLWSTRGQGEVRALHLVSFKKGRFTEPIEYSGNAGTIKGAPALTVTRDDYGDEAASVRTVVHLVWWEDDGDTNEKIYYTPIVLVDGEYLGWNPVVRLDSIGLFEGELTAGEGHLFRRATIEPGIGHSVVVGVPQRAGNRLVVMRIRLLPSTLQKLADDARSHITLVGARQHGSILSLAEQARSHITLVGMRMHQGVIDYIAEQVYLEILRYGPTFDPSDIGLIADLVWQRVVGSGASIIGNENQEEELPCSLIHLGTTPSESMELLHQVEICVMSDREAPPPIERPEPFLLLSPDGRESLVAWRDEDGGLRYRVSKDEGWGEEIAVPAEIMEVEDALEILGRIVRPEQ